MKTKIEKTYDTTWAVYLTKGKYHLLLSFNSFEGAVRNVPGCQKLFDSFLKENNLV